MYGDVNYDFMLRFWYDRVFTVYELPLAILEASWHQLGAIDVLWLGLLPWIQTFMEFFMELVFFFVVVVVQIQKK